MPMTVVITRNVEERVRGFLASTMLEVAPGVYTSPNLSAAVRERIWAVLAKWGVGTRDDDAALVTWPDAKSPGGQALQSLGQSSVQLVPLDEFVLAKPLERTRSLKTEDDVPF